MSRLLPYINIRNLFLLSVVTGIIFLGVGIGLLADSYYRASQVARVQSVVSDITSNGYRLALYTSDALTSDYRRSTRQWYAAYDKLLNTVKTHESLLSQYSRQVELINTTLDAMLPTMDELSKHRHERVSISQHDYRAHELIISQIAIRNAELESAMTELQSVVSYEVQKLLGSSWGGLYGRLLALLTFLSARSSSCFFAGQSDQPSEKR